MVIVIIPLLSKFYITLMRNGNKILFFDFWNSAEYPVDFQIYFLSWVREENEIEPAWWAKLS